MITSEPENVTDMGRLYTQICELLNTHDVPNAPWKPVVAIIAVIGCFATAIYHIAKVVFSLI